MKRFLVLAILFLATPCFGQGWQDARANITIMGGGVAYTDIIFWLNFEANDTTGTYDFSASECALTGGDTSGTYNSGGTITGTGVKVGSYAFSHPTDNDWMRFSLTSSDLFPTKGRVGFWFKIVAFDASGEVFVFSLDADNYLWLRLTGTSGDAELRVKWRAGASTQVDDASSTAANMAQGATWYFVEISWDTTLGATDYVDVYVDGTRRINSVQALSAFSPTTMTIGDGSGNAVAYAYDNFMISNDPTRNLYDGGTGLSVATSKPSGACP